MLIPRKYQSIAVAAVLLIISLTVLFYGTARLSETGFLRKIILEAAAPVQDAINIPLQSLHDGWKKYLFLVGLEDENRQLRRQNAALTEQLNLYREGRLEAERLRKLLVLKENFPQRSVAARVIDRARAPLFKTLLINKGTVDGMQPEIHLPDGGGPGGRCGDHLRPGRGLPQRASPRRRHRGFPQQRRPLSEDRRGARRRFRNVRGGPGPDQGRETETDRKSTRLNSSHGYI